MSDNARREAVVIWKSAVSAVASERLVRSHMRVENGTLSIGEQTISLDEPRHIEVVGAGKAGAGMARAAESVLSTLPPHVTWGGWINVPDDCVAELSRIRLFGARPAACNEPTSAGVNGTQEIIRRVRNLKPGDLCVVLLSGGGSALMPAPVSGVTLDDKLAITRLLMESGATIRELNAVRSSLSEVKSGGLARACHSRQLVALIISDIVGDPLEYIASGPTCVPQNTPNGLELNPLSILHKYDPQLSRVPMRVLQFLRASSQSRAVPQCNVENRIIGNNQTALRAAEMEAKTRGYQIVDLGSENCGTADVWGAALFKRLQTLKQQNAPPTCVIAGGETTVRLCDESVRGLGGRNQEIVLSAVASFPSAHSWKGITLLSAGTDGEDGPTSAAGAVADASLVEDMLYSRIDPKSYLLRNDAWSFFSQLNGLINTGPTHTNVMDVQIGLVVPS